MSTNDARAEIQEIIDEPSYPANVMSVKLEPGASFGEYALITDQPRSATVVSRGKTHVAVLSKKDY